MKITTGWSTNADPELAVAECRGALTPPDGTRPDWLIAYASSAYDIHRLAPLLQEAAGDAPLHGATSSQGVMSSAGFHSAGGFGMGLLAIFDPEGSYGVGLARMDQDPRTAGAAAVRQAIAASGRVAELPQVVWLSAPPGQEEAVLMGIQDVVGEDVLIAGGSAADNRVAGQWAEFANGQVFSDAVLVSVLYPSVRTHFAFHSGYSPTEHRGRVTRATGRRLEQIDGRPALDVYNEWTGGVLALYRGGDNVLAASAFHPLGRVVHQEGGPAFHLLSHPETVLPDGSLTLFSTIQPGEELIQMVGTPSSLVGRAGRVARSAIDQASLSPDDLAGALVVYCAGCMLSVQDQMNEVAASVRGALGETPFLGAFTFGEQGCFADGRNRHGNLMISALVFENGRRP